MTYLARLEGTFQTSSSLFISLIENWVSSGPSFSVAGIMLTVNSKCPVAILSFSDSECSPTSQPPTTTAVTIANTMTFTANSSTTESSAQSSPDYTSAIIGGVIVILIIVIAVVIIVALVLKSCRHRDAEK